MNSGISKYFLLELLAQFSSDFNSSRKRYEEEYKREHVIGMDIHLKTYKAILKELDFSNFIKYKQTQEKKSTLRCASLCGVEFFPHGKRGERGRSAKWISSLGSVYS